MTPTRIAGIFGPFVSFIRIEVVGIDADSIEWQKEYDRPEWPAYLNTWTQWIPRNISTSFGFSRKHHGRMLHTTCRSENDLEWRKHRIGDILSKISAHLSSRGDCVDANQVSLEISCFIFISFVRSWFALCVSMPFSIRFVHMGRPTRSLNQKTATKTVFRCPTNLTNRFTVGIVLPRVCERRKRRLFRAGIF